MATSARRFSNVSNGALSVVDQGVCSLSNFLTVLLLSRSLSADGFGSYVLIFNAVLICASVQHAIVTGPLRWTGAPRMREGAYVGGQLHLQAAALAVEVPLFALALAWCVADRSLVVAAVASMVAIQLHEFVRSICVTALEMRRVLRLDVVTHALRIGGLVWLWQGGHLSVTSALVTITLATLVALPLLPRGAVADPMRSTMRRNWRLGRWILADALAFTLSTRAYLYGVALWSSKVDAGGLGAAQTIVGAANVMIAGLVVAAIPVAKLKLEAVGYDAWLRWWVTTGAVVGSVGGLVYWAIAQLAEPILGFVYPHENVALVPIVAIMALGAWIDALNTVVASATWTVEKPSVNVVGKTLSALFMAAWAYPAIEHFGITGAAIGLAVTPAIWLAVNIVYVLSGALGRSGVEPLRKSAGIAA
ncbi:MAG TPA: hypothetical protein VFG38_15430 [Pseudomonadales bacterium]|nr:hypothetical protein [Pseudomonadales bacterium]